MLAKINVNGFNIYTNQIIHPKEFEKLYRKEIILTSFKTEVNNVHSKAFATFLAEERNNVNIKEGDFVIICATKADRKFEFVSQIKKWGKFHIFKEAISKLNIRNHETISFDVIKTEKVEKINKTETNIDLADLEREANILSRANGMVTIIQKGKTAITLPRFIKITPELTEMCFLIHGDGHYNTKLFFVNKDADLIRFVMDKFEEILRIPKETWRVRLLYNNPANSDLAEDRWQTLLKLKDEQFYPSVSKCVLNTSENGNLRIVIDKLIVAYVFRSIFDVIKENIRGKNAIHALNGLLCAEGSSEKSKRGLHKITISFSQKEKEMFLSILSEAGLSDFIKDRRDRFVIEGWTNCYQFFKIFLSNNFIPFDLHNSRCKNALSGFLEHSFTKSMDKYLSILNKKDSMNTNELMEETSHLGNSVRKILRKKQYLPFVHAEGRGVNRTPIKFSITPEGKEFLNIIRSIREANNEKCRFG